MTNILLFVERRVPSPLPQSSKQYINTLYHNNNHTTTKQILQQNTRYQQTTVLQITNTTRITCYSQARLPYRRRLIGGIQQVLVVVTVICVQGVASPLHHDQILITRQCRFVQTCQVVRCFLLSANLISSPLVNTKSTYLLRSPYYWFHTSVCLVVVPTCVCSNCFSKW